MSECKRCCDRVVSLLEEMRELQVRQEVQLEMIVLGSDEEGGEGIDGESSFYLDGSRV